MTLVTIGQPQSREKNKETITRECQHHHHDSPSVCFKDKYDKRVRV